ncbi:MAG: hypothetical protein R6W67_08850 [Bacteroidales bacterium]
MKTQDLFKAVIFLFIAAFLSSCKKDDQKGMASIKFEAKYTTTKSTLAEKSSTVGVIIESFKINLEEIEIEFNDNDPLFATDSVATDYELNGPFEIDLVKNGNALETIIASNVELPTAAYDEIEFKFRESKVLTSEMNGKSILVKGTINGTPFTFWSDNEIEAEIEFDQIVYLDEASKAVLTVSFDLASLFNSAVGGIDITSATDGNANGTIEIFPGDPDGNSNLASLIWAKVEYIIDAFEEK